MSTFDEVSNFERYSIDLDATEIEHKTKKQLAGLHKEALRGNQKAWHDLWLYGTKLVLKICNKLNRLGILTSFEDAVAEGNLAIGEALTRWNPKKSSFGTWVWIRVRGAVLNENGRSISTLENETDFEVGAVDREGLNAGLSGIDLVESRYVTPGDAVETAEMLDAIHLLPDRELEVVVLRYFEDLSQREVGEILGVSREMARKIEARAIDRLKLFLEQGYQGPEDLG